VVTVSIIMPNYNHSRFIERAAASVIAQTFSDFELIIIDDGSTDDSMVRAERLAQEDARVKPLSNRGNHGLPYSRNRGIKAASGRYFCFIDSDDIFRPQRVDKMLKLIENEPETFSYSDIFKIDDQDQVIQAESSSHMPPDGNAYAWILSHGLTGTSPILVPRSLVDKVGLYNESLVWGEDLDYILRLTERFQIAVVRQPLYGYRIHQARKTDRMKMHACKLIEVGILESHLTRNWELFDDSVRYRTIRRIQQYSHLRPSERVWKIIKWSANPSFMRVGSKRLVNKVLARNFDPASQMRR